jgi:hypothetical protein
VFALPVAGARDTSFAVPASAGSAAAAVLSRR